VEKQYRRCLASRENAPAACACGSLGQIGASRWRPSASRTAGVFAVSFWVVYATKRWRVT
jgi:hypothetical protein